MAAQQVMFTVGAAALAVGGVSGGAGVAASSGQLPYVFDVLVQYAAAAENSMASMLEEDMRAIASVLRQRMSCSLLVFGLGAKRPLRRTLNHSGRTMFLDENPYYVAHLEGMHLGLEAYDMACTTVMREFPDLLDTTCASQQAKCHPDQNHLFSICRLTINDLPNKLYEATGSAS